MTIEPPLRARVGPRESLTVTATEREVDGWRVAAAMAGEKLADWVVSALNEAARTTIAAREGGRRGSELGSDPSPAISAAVPGSWGPRGGSRPREPMEGLPPPAESAPEGRTENPRAGLTTAPAPAAHPRPWGPRAVPQPAGRVVRMPPAPAGPPDPHTEIPSAVLSGIEAVRRSGATNMLDWPAVADVAKRLGFPNAARWVRENPPTYARGVFQGFREAGQ